MKFGGEAACRLELLAAVAVADKVSGGEDEEEVPDAGGEEAGAGDGAARRWTTDGVVALDGVRQADAGRGAADLDGR